MKKKILFITDLDNGEEEDIITVNYLKDYFDIKVSYYDNIESIENDFDLIVIRNSWPSDKNRFKDYNFLKKDFLVRAEIKKLNIYNSLGSSVDRNGKNYLLDLYSQRYSVIPSIDDLSDFDLLPVSDEYIIKPKNGFSSIGVISVKREDIFDQQIKDCIIQPKLHYKNEVSFYFIDGVLLYCCIFEPSKIPRWPKPRLLEPSNKDIDFAMNFVKRKNMDIGIQRIDAVRLLDDSLLLLEIEDDSPYFSLTEIPIDLQRLFLETFKKSLEKQMALI